MYRFDQFEVMPLFSCPVAVVDVKEDCSELESLKHYKYLSSKKGSLRTVDNKVLNDFPRVKQVLLGYLDYYVHMVLELGPVSIGLTTSWGTQNTADSLTETHIHRNSLLSGVFYYTTMQEGDEIQFSRPVLNSVFTGRETNHTLFNSDMWRFGARKNRLILFPSHVPHKLIVGQHSFTRWSLAFNAFPTGSFGDADSSLEVTVNE